MTPERTAEIIRLFAPIALGALVAVAGVVTRNVSVVATGAGMIGIPGVRAE